MYAVKRSGGWYRVELSARSRNGLKAGSKGWVAKAHLEPNVCTQLDWSDPVTT